MFHDAFRGRRVFVTGHTGFKGSWLAFWLCRLGARVRGYALSPGTDPALFDLLKLERHVEHQIGDVRDSAQLERSVVDFSPEVVFHLAAQPIVLESFERPRETFETNVQGTVNLLEAVRRSPSTRAVVVVTSDKCYERDEAILAHREGDPLGGSDPYSASKACAEIATAAFRRSFFFVDGAPGLATARAGNVIGGGDWAAHRIVPDAIRALEKKRALVVRSPTAMRPWQHVLDPLAGYMCLAIRLLERPGPTGGAWNFGPQHGQRLTVGEMVDRLHREMGCGSRVVRRQATPSREQETLGLCCEKAAAMLDWCPVFGIDEAVHLTAGWYRRHMEGLGAARLCSADLRRYLAAARRRGDWWAR
ncbi:MAG: CDP-glucose 4,6-dehydratase [Deltaproteobacteria bacterium]|nr:CDP-glucose 4,6-dehydratase [Deltaproteobacteria bacterium]